MKKLQFYLMLFLFSVIIAGTLQINFNNSDSSAVYDFNEIKNLEITESEILEGMVYVKGGTFWMGDHTNAGDSDELPVHFVGISDFYIGKYEVTQSEWLKYMTLVFSYAYGEGDTHPHYNVNWYGTLIYCNKRSIDEGLAPCYTINGSINPDDWGSMPFELDSLWDAAVCNWDAEGYRLPTEAEWEYAARGGIHWSDLYLYSGSNEIDSVGWYQCPPYPQYSIAAGSLQPNQIGIYDMTGNVWEWVWDWSDYPEYDYYQICYDQGTVINPKGPDSPSSDTILRRLRGGSWETPPLYCRNANRSGGWPDGLTYNIGFRIVRTKK